VRNDRGVNMQMRKVVTGVGLVCVAVAAWAADPVVEAGRQCTQIKDSLARLVCFDKAFEASPAESAAASVPVAVVAPVATPVPAVVPAPAALPAPAVVPALGDESVRKLEGRDAEPQTPTNLTATVTAVKQMRPDVFRVTLDNGQVWLQSEMSSLFSASIGDTIRIEKGALGSYRMARVSPSKSGWVRVTRQR
jgi:hypothetical protein